MRQKHGKKLMEEFKASKSSDVVVFSRSKVRNLLDLQRARDQPKKQLEIDKAPRHSGRSLSKSSRLRRSDNRRLTVLVRLQPRTRRLLMRKLQGKLQERLWELENSAKSCRRLLAEGQEEGQLGIRLL